MGVAMAWEPLDCKLKAWQPEMKSLYEAESPEMRKPTPSKAGNTKGS